MNELVFRASTPDDAAAIAALCERVLLGGEPSPMFDAGLMSWKYWRPWPTWLGARSYVLERGREVVAHIAAIPVTFRHDGVKYTLLHPLDWAARPEVVGVGVLLLQKLLRIADGLLVVGGSAMTQRVLPPLGFQRLTDVCRYVALPRAELAEGLELRPLALGEAPSEALTGALEPALLPVRSADLVELWRECPALEVSGYCVLDQAQHAGGFLIGVAPGQARLIDVWADPSRPEAWARVLSAGRCAAYRLAGVAEVVTVANTPLERTALAVAGFEPCGDLPMFIQLQGRALPEHALLRFQMLDGDLAFLHRGRAESWLDLRAPS